MRVISRPSRKRGSRGGFLPARANSASSACIPNSRPVCSATYAAPPAWSACAWVSISRVTSDGPEPIEASAAITFGAGLRYAHVDQRHLLVVVAEHEAVDEVADQRDAPDTGRELDGRSLGHPENLRTRSQGARSAASRRAARTPSCRCRSRRRRPGPPSPSRDTARPTRRGAVGVAAGVELLVAVQPDVADQPVSSSTSASGRRCRRARPTPCAAARRTPPGSRTSGCGTPARGGAAGRPRPSSGRGRRGPCRRDASRARPPPRWSAAARPGRRRGRRRRSGSSPAAATGPARGSARGRALRMRRSSQAGSRRP